MPQDPKKPDEPTGMPPTPTNLTSTGAPVDERFVKPQPPAEENTAAARRPKSEAAEKDEEENGDHKRSPKKRR